MVIDIERLEHGSEGPPNLHSQHSGVLLSSLINPMIVYLLHHRRTDAEAFQYLEVAVITDLSVCPNLGVFTALAHVMLMI